MRAIPALSPWSRLAVFALLAAVLTLPWLDNRSLWFPDEPDVGEPAREMLARGDWVVPTHNGDWWLDYPPLTYWAGMTVARLAGSVSEPALRLPSALAAILLALVLVRFLIPRMGETAAFGAGLVLITSPQYLWQAINVHPDMLNACFQGLGLVLYLSADRRSGWTAWAWRIAGFACFAAAWLAKGPFGLLLPGFVLTLWLLSYRRWKEWLLLAILALLPVALVLIWYVPLARRIGADPVWHELASQNFARISSGSRGHGQPWYYYFKRIWDGFGLWTPALIGVIVVCWRQLWADRWRRLALLWFLGTFVLLTAATTKREVYLLPCYPAVAILVGSWLASAIRSCAASGVQEPTARAAHGMRLLAILALVAALVVAIAGTAGAVALPAILVRFATDLDPAHRDVALRLRPTLAILAAAMVPVTVALAVGLRKRRAILQVSGMIGLHLGLWLVAVALVLPAIDQVKSYRTASNHLMTRLPDSGDVLGFISPEGESFNGMKRTGYLFYTRRHLTMLPTTQAVEAYLAADPRRLVLAKEKSLRQLGRDPRLGAFDVEHLRVGGETWVILGGTGQRGLR